MAEWQPGDPVYADERRTIVKHCGACCVSWTADVGCHDRHSAGRCDKPGEGVVSLDRNLWVNEAVARRVGFTPAHLDVLCGIAVGQTNAAIGRELSLAEDSVKNQVSRMLRLVGANDRAHLVAIAYDKQLLRNAADRVMLAEDLKVTA